MAERALREPPAAVAGRQWRMAAPLARFSLRVDLQAAAALRAESMPLARDPCSSRVEGDWAALWLGPDEQLLLGPDGGGAQFASRLAAAWQGLPYSLVDVSHRQAAIEVTGPHAVDLLSAGCPLDLDVARFPVQMCTRTVMAKTEIVLWRRADEQFHIEIWRSFVPYLSGFLAVAGREFA